MFFSQIVGRFFSLYIYVLFSDSRTVFLSPPFALAKALIYEFPAEKDRG